MVLSRKTENKTFEHERLVPRYPLPKEQIKFFFEGTERVFGVRDISTKGLGITLLDHGEVLLFPVGFDCEAELKIGGAPVRIKLRVARISAWAIGFTFEELSKEALAAVERSIQPIKIAKSLQSVPAALAAQAVSRGVSSWYHGDGNTNLYLWFDRRGGIERAMFCFGDRVWDWSIDQGPRTGSLEQLEGLDMRVNYDASMSQETTRIVSSVLDHADVLDFRLTKFLREQLVIR